MLFPLVEGIRVFHRCPVTLEISLLSMIRPYKLLHIESYSCVRVGVGTQCFYEAPVDLQRKLGAKR